MQHRACSRSARWWPATGRVEPDPIGPAVAAFSSCGHGRFTGRRRAWHSEHDTRTPRRSRASAPAALRSPHAARVPLHSTTTLQPPRLRSLPRGGGPLARQRATRRPRAERTSNACVLPSLHLCGGAPLLHDPSGARHEACAGAREGEARRCEGRSHGNPAPIQIYDRESNPGPALSTTSARTSNSPSSRAPSARPSGASSTTSARTSSSPSRWPRRRRTTDRPPARVASLRDIPARAARRAWQSAELALVTVRRAKRRQVIGSGLLNPDWSRGTPI
jgi:hypothetical protein